MASGRNTKVLKLHILKPSGDMKWDELGRLLREARYRVFRLANIALSETYLSFHQARKNPEQAITFPKISKINRELRETLIGENKKRKDQCDYSNRFSATGALPDTVVGALSQYKLASVFAKSKWADVLKGKSSLPSFRLNMAIPIRCDKDGQRKLYKSENGDIEIELMICSKPYPRVIIATARNSLGDGQKAILERLIERKDGYRQRVFEVKEDQTTRKWHLFVTYDFPKTPAPKLSKERIVGVDLGFSCPLYAAINNGYARLGWRQFASLKARIRSLQNQVIKRRREIQQGGKDIISGDMARSGHGRKRKLQPISILEGKINNAYTTINHQMSAAVIKFAKDNGAGVIQIEDLSGLQIQLTGTFLGQRWRYEELQRFIKYKASEVGIEIKEINPKYTSRRCSECGFINLEFTRQYRDTHGGNGKTAKFICPKCGYEADADYNAAKNLATPEIEKLIEESLKLDSK